MCRNRRVHVRKFGLAATIAFAVLAVFGVSLALLVFDPRVNGADALRTGGFAGGSVVALYALWLNDRRRRVEENRQLQEGRQVRLDQERVSDERFARAVELLGHEADQVRVGALHSLAGLARSNPGLTQTVLDVLCSYLRRPFLHPRYDDGEWQRDEQHEAERKLQVRRTAQRLIATLLPQATDTAAPAYDLDLTNAKLEYLDLSGRRIGTLTARHARIFRDINLSRCEITGPVWFTRVVFADDGKFRCKDTVFHDRAQFSGVEFGGPAAFDRSEFRGRARFDQAKLHSGVTFDGARFAGPLESDGATVADADLDSLLALTTRACAETE
ncbi:pentapeptide repeat-containing protein [Saccharopolyspora sp. SCSIO 74807]